MKELKFKFDNNRVSIKGKTLHIDIPDKVLRRRFDKEFLFSLQEKYNDHNIILNNIKELKKFEEYELDKLKVNEKIKTVLKVISYEEVFKDGKYIYNILAENYSTQYGIKLLLSSKNKKEIIINGYYLVEGEIRREEKKEYEKTLKFNKNILVLSKFNYVEIPKKELLKFKRFPLCCKSINGNGFISDEKIKNFEDIKGYCYSDFNTLNFVMQSNNEIPLSIEGYILIKDKYYTVNLFLNSQDEIIKFNGRDIKVNKGIRLFNELISSSETYNDKFVFDVSILLKNKDKIKIGSMDHNGFIFQNVLNNNSSLLNEYLELFDIFGIEPLENISLDKPIDKIKEVNLKTSMIANEFKKILVFNESASVLEEKDKSAVKEFMLYQKIKNENIKNVEPERQRIYLNKINRLYTVSEVIEELTEQGFNFNQIDYMLFEEMMFYYSLPKKKDITIIPKELLIDNHKEDKEMLKNIIKKKLSEMTFSSIEEKKKVIERVKQELEIILKKNYQKLFLTAYTAVKRSNDLGYPTGDRGTAGCMYICYLLGITSSDPIKYNLDYKMFLGPHLEKVPDIDINISNDILKDILDEMKNYTTNSMKASISSSYKENSIKSQILNKTNPNIDIYYACCVLNNKISRIQPHNSGLILLPEIDYYYIFPTIEYNGEKIPLYPYEYLDKVLIKLDLLSKTDIGILKTLKDNIGLENIDLEDEEVYKKINIDSSEISELNTDFARKIIHTIKPKCFNDLIKIQGLLHGKGVLESIKNKKIIACREDLIELLEHFKVKDSFLIMEKIRKGNHNLTEEQNKELEKLPVEYRDTISKIQYLFPRSHALSYAKQAYFSCYYNMNKDKLNNKKKNKNDEEFYDLMEEFMED